MRAVVIFDELGVPAEAGTHSAKGGSIHYQNIVLTDEQAAKIAEFNGLCSLGIDRESERTWTIDSIDQLHPLTATYA